MGLNFVHGEHTELLDLAPDAIIASDAGGRICYWNRGAEELYGWRREEAIGGALHHLLDTRFPESREQVIESLLAMGQWEGELDQATRSGARLVVDSRQVLRRSGPGEPATILEINRDITRHKQAQAALYENDRRLRDAQALAEVGFWELDIDTGAFFYSDGMYRLLERDPAEDAPRLPLALGYFRPEDRDQVQALIQRAVETGAPWEHDVRVQLPSGRQVWHHNIGAAIRDSRGRVARLHGVTQDITQRKQAEAMLQDSRARFQSLFDELPTPVWEEDFSAVKSAIGDLKRSGVSDFKSYFEQHPDTLKAMADLIRFTDMNRAALAMRSLDDKEQLVSEARKSFEPDAYQSLARELIRIAEGQTRFDLEREIQLPDGDRRSVILHWAAAAGHETTLSRVLVTVMDVTALKQAQATLDAFFAGSPVGMVIVDRDQRVVRVNQVMAGIVGLPIQDLIGRKADDMAPELAQLLMPVAEQVMAAGVPALNLEASSPSFAASGVERTFLGSFFPIPNARGQPEYLGSTVVDITPLKQVEVALRASEQQLAAIFRASPGDMAVIRLSDNQYIDVNPAWQATTGYTRSEAIGRTPSELNFWARLAERDEVLRRLREQGAVRNYELHVRRKTGEVVDVLFSADLIEVAGENCMLSMGIDITERNRAVADLRDSEARFSTIFQASPVGISISDPGNGAIVDVNPAFVRIFGYTRGEVVGHSSDELGMWADAKERAGALDRLRSQNRDRNAHAHARRKSGEIRDVLLSAEHIDVAGRTYIVTLVNDITEATQAEESLHRAQKLEALGTLAGGVAHDFNNLLLAISGNAALASADLPPGHPAQESLTEITRASARAASLVRQILAFGRPQEQKRETADIRPVVEEALKLLRVSLPWSVRLETHYADAMPLLLCNTTQVHQAVVNLVTNAVQAIAQGGIGDSGGRVEVSVDAVTVDAGMAQITPDLHPGRYALLAVSDNGPGMDAITLRRIFDPFFTTKPVGQGTGLGLSVVHGIMQSHGGAVTVSSQPGQGTTFHLYFPIAEGAERQVVPERRDAGSGQGGRVLFIDDEDALVFLVSRVLRRLGYEVAGYTSSAQALEAFRARPSWFDVVVTDLSMPGMNGFDLAQAMQAAQPDVPIVMTTGYIRPEDQDRVVQLGIRELILKPDTVDEMGRVLDQLFSDIHRRRS